MVKNSHSFTATMKAPRTVVLSVSMPGQLWEQVNEYRRLNDMTMSRAVSELLQLGLVGHKLQPKGGKK